ncbi:MAG: hypothetical protein ACMG51_02915 [Ginsengibacter sp.]
MINKHHNIFLSLLALSFISLLSCNKNKAYPIIQPQPQVHFVSTNSVLSYYVENSATTTFAVQIGTTDVSNVDRTVSFNITSPTGAVAGTNYTVTTPGNSVVIPAGQSIATIVLHGIFAPYADGTRKDTLNLTLTEPSVKVAGFNNSVQIVLQRYCAVDLTALLGNYNKTYDYQSPGAYGPYTATVISATSTGPTSAKLVIQNFAAAGFGPFGPSDPSSSGVTVNIDYSNPANFSTSLPSQGLSVDATYGLITVGQVGKGSFSSCDNTITVSYQATVSAGSFGNFQTVLKR